jgi:hypothetical protein
MSWLASSNIGLRIFCLTEPCSAAPEGTLAPRAVAAVAACSIVWSVCCRNGSPSSIGLAATLTCVIALVALYGGPYGCTPLLQSTVASYFAANWHPGQPHNLGCGALWRVGSSADGGKGLCLDVPGPQGEDCVVLSIGSNGDFTFETSMHAIAPLCDIHTFDGTMQTGSRAKLLKAAKPQWVHFHHVNFDSQSHTSIREMLAKRRQRVWVLKMDCEGCEFESLLPFLRDVCIDILLLEIHPKADIMPTHQLLSSINQTLGLYYREPNFDMLAEGKPGYFELAFRRRPGVAACELPTFRATSKGHHGPRAKLQDS